MEQGQMFPNQHMIPDLSSDERHYRPPTTKQQIRLQAAQLLTGVITSGNYIPDATIPDSTRVTRGFGKQFAMDAAVIAKFIEDGST